MANVDSAAGGPWWLPGATASSGEPADVERARLQGELERGVPRSPWAGPRRAVWPFKPRKIDVEMGLVDAPKREKR